MTSTEEDDMARGLRSTGRHTRPHSAPDAGPQQDRHRVKYRADVRLPVEEGPDLLAFYAGLAAASGRSRNDLYAEALIDYARARGYGQADKATDRFPGLLAARTMPGEGPTIIMDRQAHNHTEEDHS